MYTYTQQSKYFVRIVTVYQDGKTVYEVMSVEEALALKSQKLPILWIDSK